MGIFSKIKKSLKKTTKILDPVGAKIRKSTGGSYMDPLNQYNSKPNTAPAYQPRASQGLIAPPSGPAPPGIKFGGSSGGYNYVPNQFSGGAEPPAGPASVGGPTMGKPTVMPQTAGGAMSFGGPQMASPTAPPGNMVAGAPRTGWAAGPRMGNVMGQAMQQYGAQQPQQAPAMQNQLAKIQAMRGRMV